MEVDAAQYASISLEMLQKGSYLQVFHRNLDYLDKPPMLFWLASTSFNIFGVQNWSFKLPAVFVLISGIYATFRLGSLLYNRQIGIFAGIILATTQALFLMTNDVRTDGILLGFGILAVWQYVEYEKFNKGINFVISAVFLACALMSKGPIALIIFLSAIGTYFLVQNNWKRIFSFSWLFYFLIVAVFLLPMCYGLYLQYDMHPEKVVYGLNGPSGIKFFFWTQSFGRITGDIYWANNTSFFTFFHTFLWDFQPWAILAILALVFKISRIKNAFIRDSNEEFLSLGGFVFPFIALSLSKFRLPHYIFPLFPFMAIILSQFLLQNLDKLKFKKALLYIQFGLMHVFYLALAVSYLYFFPLNNLFAFLIFLLGFASFYMVFISKKLDESLKILYISIITSIVFGFNMSSYFYPQLLHYQSESVLGKQIKEGKYEKKNIYNLNVSGHSLDFYSGKIIESIKINQIEKLPIKSLVFTDELGKVSLLKSANFIIKEKYQDYPVTQLNINFLKKNTRNKKLNVQYLLEKIN